MDRNVFAVGTSKPRQPLFRDGQHAAGAARAVVDQVGAGLDPIGDRQKDQIGHKLDHVARREMLAGLLVVFLVEAADQLLKDRAHPVVVEA